MENIMANLSEILTTFMEVLIKFTEAVVPADVYQYFEEMFNEMLVGVAPSWNEIWDTAITAAMDMLF